MREFIYVYTFELFPSYSWCNAEKLIYHFLNVYLYFFSSYQNKKLYEIFLEHTFKY